jgi:predicted AlkP superfamily pyrophosphatase or phosphodiesterase
MTNPKVNPLFLILSLVLFAAEATHAAIPKYILFLTADGFRSDYIEWYQPTNLQQLIAKGVRIKNAQNVFPTVTTPNMTALITGAYPRTTGIAANSQYIKEDDTIVKSPRLNHAETIGETLQKAGWKTAGVNHFMLSHRGADWYVAPGYDDSEKTTDEVLKAFKRGDIRFVGAIYGATDHAGHRHGPKSEEVKQAVLGIDHAVGRLLAGLKQQGIYDQTAIAFSSDHGMSAFETNQVSPDPAQALKQAGFQVATSEAELKQDTEIVVLDAGVRLIYFRKVSPDQKKKATAVLSAVQGAELLDRQKLDKLGCHNNRSGDLVLSPLPGFTISRAGAKGGQHGRFTERNPILFFAGRGFKQGVIIDSAETVDVVPTLLRLVGVAPSKTVDGQAIVEALEQ